MALPASSTFHHLRTLSRLVHPTRSISIHPCPPRFPPAFPARPRIEHAPPRPGPEQAPRPLSHRPGDTRAPIERRPTNRQIPFDHVYVVDPHTKKLSETKQSLKELLETRDRRVIELVASDPEPIVRVTTRSEIEARYKELKKALRKGVEESKEVHLSWGVAKADLEHKLRKARRDLEKGHRVVVVLNMKKGHKPFNRQQLVVFADEISGALCDVGKEWKKREFSERSIILSFR